MNREDEIAHVLPDTGPHLNHTISRLITQVFPNGKIYLREEYQMFNTTKGFAENVGWINSLPQGIYAGQLLARKNITCKGYIGVFVSLVLPEFTLRSMFRIIRGPKFWVVHGRPLKFGTILWMRIFAKRVSVIHWGGHASPLSNRKSRFFFKMAYTLLNKYYVLMSPEAKGFREMIGRDIVAVLPYPIAMDSEDPSAYHSTIDIEKRMLILGNSGYSRDLYCEILDKIESGSWKKIICMLNYGREGDVTINEEFLAKYAEKFGEEFFAWRETLPFTQYVEKIKKPMCYIGPQRHQSGLGAIFFSIIAGRAVFLRGDNYQWLKELGIEVYCIDEIADWSYENILKYVPTASVYRKNCQAIIRHSVEIANADYWRNVLVSDFNSRH